MEAIKEKMQNSKTSDTIKFVVKKSELKLEFSAGGEEEMERLENIKELVTLALKYDNLPDGHCVEKLLEDASLASDQDSLMINTHTLTSPWEGEGQGVQERGTMQ